ncbi:hypothetical protein ACN38_g10966 [Penicillium nordicum]|uniref:Uncharacterized protein n=1 Tax=Penicillium nordicum TaxID=229535 RepID=A0A0M8NRZ9_9EURO|nr:hypothetical protein ACN38_g10966 [Penicillium nordicum]
MRYLCHGSAISSRSASSSSSFTKSPKSVASCFQKTLQRMLPCSPFQLNVCQMADWVNEKTGSVTGGVEIGSNIVPFVTPPGPGCTRSGYSVSKKRQGLSTKMESQEAAEENRLPML